MYFCSWTFIYWSENMIQLVNFPLYSQKIHPSHNNRGSIYTYYGLLWSLKNPYKLFITFTIKYEICMAWNQQSLKDLELLFLFCCATILGKRNMCLELDAYLLSYRNNSNWLDFHFDDYFEMTFTWHINICQLLSFYLQVNIFLNYWRRKVYLSNLVENIKSVTKFLYPDLTSYVSL